MIEIKEFKKTKSNKYEIKANNPLDLTKRNEIKQFLVDNKDTISVRWSSVPGKEVDGKTLPEITYSEINVFVKTPEEFRKLFSINGFNKPVKDEKTGKYVSQEMTLDEKKRISLGEIAAVIKQDPDKILNILNKMTSSRQKYPKAFYSQVDKVVMREKNPGLYKGSGLFEVLDETLSNFDANKLDVMVSRNASTGDIYLGFLDKEIEILGRKPQYVLKLDDSLAGLDLPEYENPGKFINDPKLGKAIAEYPLKPKLEFTRNLNLENGDRVIEFRYSLSRTPKQEQEIASELTNDLPQIKIKK